MAQTMMTTSSIVCEACDVNVHPKAYEQHINGKKHKMRQDEYDKKYKTIFVSGTKNFSPESLKKIFKRYGEISNVHKIEKKPFSFIKFVNKESVEKALNERTFVEGRRLFVDRCNYISNRRETDKEKSRRLSETLSNSSMVELDPGQVGVRELPVRLEDPDWRSEGTDILLWQVQDFISQVEIPNEMWHSLDEVKSDVESLFQYTLPGCKVIVFGSCGTTLAFKNSDVDLFLQTANGEQPQDFVRKEAKDMYRSRLFNVIARIPSARVPIIKFEHVRTGWQGDLTANSQLGVCNSLLIRFLISLDPRIKPLVMVIKYWAKVCGITGTHVRLTTYSLVMLVIFYLQQLYPPILPTIAQLQQLSQHKQYSLGWECSFCDEEWRVQSECLPQPNELSLRELLTGFFRFYHNFDFCNVICPLLGRSIPVNDFESDDGSDLPDEIFLYKEKLKSDPKCKFRTDVNMRVQDPFELCLNITRNVIERTYFVFKEACKVSLELCEKEDDGTLLKSLFSIDQESLDTSDDSVRLFINFKEETSDSSEASESALEQWYELTTGAIMLVLTEILKFKVNPPSVKLSSKVKKLESSQDVHTPMSNHKGDKLVFVCCGKADLWHSRKKMNRFINRMKIALNVFEREVCISNALYSPDEKNSFSCTIVISSLDEFKKNRKGIEVKANVKTLQNPLVKGFIQFIKYEFLCFVPIAGDFINTVKRSSPVTEVKESLKELFELKLENLPDLKELMNMKNAAKSDKVIGKQSGVIKSLNRNDHSDGEIIDNEQNRNDNSDGEIIDNEQNRNDNSDGEIIDNEQKVKQRGPTIRKFSSEIAAEYEAMKSVHSPKNMPNVETQKLVHEFFKPTSPNQINVLKNSSKTLEKSEIDKFSDLLTTIQNIETQSAFTSDVANPFLASIEKVALNSLVESQTGKQDKLEIQSAESEDQNEETREATCISNTEKQDKLEVQSAVCKDQHEETEKVTCISNKEKEAQDSEEIQKVSEVMNKKNENQGEVSDKLYEQKKICVDKNTTINEDVPSSSQEKSFEKEEHMDRVMSEQKSETKISLQRPNIHSETPSKQRKPNRNNKNAHYKQVKMWVGGGPPGCQQWKEQDHPTATCVQQPSIHSERPSMERNPSRDKNTPPQETQPSGLSAMAKTSSYSNSDCSEL